MRTRRNPRSPRHSQKLARRSPIVAGRARGSHSDEGCQGAAFSCDKFLVPAGVVVIGGVERLMQVADEVQKELEREKVSLSTRQTRPFAPHWGHS
jgi:hypothetical protein